MHRLGQEAQTKLRYHARSLVRAYRPPSWAVGSYRHPEGLRGADSQVWLGAEHVTPIQPWFLSSNDLPDGYSVHIKRDDFLRGGASAGNKVRKLSFIFAQALENGCDSIISCGGVYSNHARITTSMSRELGLEPLMLLRSATPEDGQQAGTRGNMFLHHALGCRVYLTRQDPFETGLRPKMERIIEQLRVREGRHTHLIGVGGSDCTGLWGYIDAWRELEEQGVSERFDDVVVAVGSGGTAAGLAIGAHLAGSPVRVHAVAVCDDAKYFHDHTDGMLQTIGLYREADDPSPGAAAGGPGPGLAPTGTRSREILDVIEGYKGAGYGRARAGDYDFIQRIATETGVLLDQTYTGKAVQGMLAELKTSAAGDSASRGGDPQAAGRFRGKRVLYVHTGGAMGLMDGRADYHFNRGTVWPYSDACEGIGGAADSTA